MTKKLKPFKLDDELLVRIGAIADETVAEPFDGASDLTKKVIRTPLAPDRTFDDDPLRMMRAVRFASQLRFIIKPDAIEAIRRKAERIGIVSAERITDEFLKILGSEKP